MKLTYEQFFKQLAGARLCAKRWPAVDYNGALWAMFAFDDGGVHWLDHRARKLQAAIAMCDRQLHYILGQPRQAGDWGDEVKKHPGYFEPVKHGWVIQ
jgi:hypothetical protein